MRNYLYFLIIINVKFEMILKLKFGGLQIGELQIEIWWTPVSENY